MKYVGPVAKGAGQDFETTAAAIAMMGNAGIQGSMAGTSLRGAMSRLLTPSKEAAGIMRRLGLNAQNSDGSLRNFTDIVADLESAGMTAGEAMMLFGQRAGPAVMSLVDQGSDALRDMEDQLRNSDGTADQMAETMQEGLAGSLTELSSALESAAIAFGEVFLPLLEKVSDFLAPLIKKFGDLPAPVKIIIIALAGAAAVIGPLLIAIGFMIPAITALSGVFAVLSLSMGPITIAIIAIAAAVAAGILIWKNWDKIVAVFKTTFEVVKSVFESVSSKVSELFNSKWGWILPGGILFKAIKLIRDNWDDIWGAITILAQIAWDKIKKKFKEHFSWLLPNGLIHQALKKAKTKFGEVWDAIRAKFGVVGKLVSGIWDEHFAWMRPGGLLFRALGKLKDKWKSIWDSIAGALKAPLNIIIGGINTLLRALNAVNLGWEAKTVSFGGKTQTILPGFKFSPFNFGEIPSLGKGGIVSRPTLAMVGERGPEAVVPLSGGGGVGGITININGPTYGFDDFERKVGEAIRDGVRRGGYQGILQTG